METSPLPSLAILLTSFNRRETTLATLSSIDAAVLNSCNHQIVLVDDASTDGTGDAVKASYPDSIVISGKGSLYWNGGMRAAWLSALALKPDFFLWLNDDTVLRPGAIADLIAFYNQAKVPKAIIVGCTTAATGEITYGGYCIASGLSRLRFRRLAPDEFECDTMNGNCVLFPASAAADIGINSEYYRHAFGDIDYGFRARRAGYVILELKEPVSKQELNEHYARSIERLTFRNWRFIFNHPKGIPIREWYFFCRQHGGPMWPLNFVLRYFKIASLE